MPLTTGKFVHRRRCWIYLRLARLLFPGLVAFWLGCAGHAHGQANLAPSPRFDAIPGTFPEQRRAVPDLQLTPWRSLDAMIEEARRKSGTTLTPQELIQDRKKRLELPAEPKVAPSDLSPLPINAANKIWEVPVEKTSGSALGFLLATGAAIAAFVAAWKAGWFRRKIEKPAP